MEMNEIEREAILAQRLEEMQRLQDQRSLDQLVRMQRGGMSTEDSIAKSAKRRCLDSCTRCVAYALCVSGPHAVRGATKEKSKKLDELKARRKAKDDKKRVHASFLPVAIRLMLIPSRAPDPTVSLHQKTWTCLLVRKRTDRLQSKMKKKRVRGVS
jgi:hypothetical protein